MTTMNPETKFRHRCVYVSKTQILSMFQRPVEDVANFFYLQGEPKNVEVVNVYFDSKYSAFCFIVTHPSFDLVNIGEPIPIHDQIFTIRLQHKPEYENMNP